MLFKKGPSQCNWTRLHNNVLCFPKTEQYGEDIKTSKRGSKYNTHIQGYAQDSGIPFNIVTKYVENLA